jgi:SWI/SNF-related matrix-associated actin-dependent regulator of chromatin subfamily A member 5
LDKFGLDAENLHDMIRDEIRESPMFRFDWFFLSRTSLEISRRCTTLISTVAREFEENGNGMASTKAAALVKKGRDREEEEEEEGPPAKKGKSNSGAATGAKETNGKMGKPPKASFSTYLYVTQGSS